MTEKQNDVKKLIDKMRSNTERQQRKTLARPLRRSRIKMQKNRQAEGSDKKE